MLICLAQRHDIWFVANANVHWFADRSFNACAKHNRTEGIRRKVWLASVPAIEPSCPFYRRKDYGTYERAPCTLPCRAYPLELRCACHHCHLFSLSRPMHSLSNLLFIFSEVVAVVAGTVITQRI